MREIGSEFWDVSPLGAKNNLFPESTQWYLSGRSALKAIIEDLHDCRTVAMPSWCCDSMIRPFIEAGIDVYFYPVWYDGKIIQDISIKCDVLFLIDYFGYTGTQPNLRGFKGVIIRDVTHSLFSTISLDSDYYFGSLRKWCGVWTGGFAWTRDGHKLSVGSINETGYVCHRETAMKQKSEYICGIRKDKGYLELFRTAEKALDGIGICSASDRDISCAQFINVDEIRRMRRTNADVLKKAFSDWLLFPNMKKSECPLFVPIIVPDKKRDKLKQFLIENEIYCPVHWPISKYHKLNNQTRYIYENELSLVCDQRYSEDDINRIVETIRLFWTEV